MITVAQSVKQLRLKQDLTLCQLAEMSNTSASTISRLENDHDNIKFSTIIDIFYQLGFTLTLKLKPRDRQSY